MPGECGEDDPLVLRGLATRPYGTSTGYWRDGFIGSSNLYGAIGGERSSGLPASRGDSHRCLSTGGG
jgi:hypothetical protein